MNRRLATAAAESCSESPGVGRCADAPIEVLEPRRLLAAIDGVGNLVVSGDNNSNSIAIGMSGGSIYVLGEPGQGEQNFNPGDVTGKVKVYGLNGDDWIQISSTLTKETYIEGGAGGDTVFAGSQDAEIHGGAGRDVVYGGAGEDLIFGDADGDTLYGGDAYDELHGGAGEDELDGEGGNDYIWGDADVDLLFDGSGVDHVYGGAGDDYFACTFDNELDYFDGGDGDFDTWTVDQESWDVENSTSIELGAM